MGFITASKNTLKKTAPIFAILSVYIVAAFAWWTYAHIASREEIYLEEVKNLELLPYKATLDIRDAVEQGMFNDTNDLKKYFYLNYPELYIEFHSLSDPMSNYMITPKNEVHEQITDRYVRKRRMYALEGFVMVSLLFWGIIWIYRSLQNRLNLKKQQSNFLLSITHELKTPLASIKLSIETLLKRPNLEREQTNTMLRNSLSDVTRLRDLVDNLLMAAQLDSHKFNLTFSPSNLSELLIETADKFVLPRNLQHRTLMQVQPNVTANIDPIAMEMVLTNLISNAFKYSPKDAPVSISLKTDQNLIRISVADQGSGISAEDKKNLFDKFYRAEDENIRKTKGTGLGLFIVKNLLNLHGATIQVHDNLPSGVIFEVTLQQHAT